MRSDLTKVLCERQRFGSGLGFRQVRHRKAFRDFGLEGEGQPQREGMKLRHRRHTKNFGELLRPLLGQVRKYVGRPWNELYGDLCRNFDMRAVTSQHLLEHLEDFCEHRIIVKDGELWVDSLYEIMQRPLKDSAVEFYVDPRDGVIRRNLERKTNRQRIREQRAKEAAVRAASFRILDAKNVLRKIDGLWYHFTLERIPSGRYVYVKPEGCDLFRVSGGRQKHWDQLASWERHIVGIARFEGKNALDLYTGKRVYLDGKTPRESSHNADCLPASLRYKYHATKKTAAHRELRRAGLISVI